MEWLSKRKSKSKDKRVSGRLVMNQRFALAARFLAPVAPLVRKGFATRLKQRTPMGRAMSHVMNAAIEGTYPDQRIDPAKVLLSVGNVPNPMEVSLIRLGDQLRGTWVWEGQRAMDGFSQVFWDDEVILCAYNADERIAGINDRLARREDGEVSLSLPAELRKVAVDVYMLTCSRDQLKYSRSIYLGRF